ncbi:serine hydrolase-domain-containing protein [Cercophora newfieldiana]|uniref:Serine hydrolase-domain-containing protein n=1 Tax=Cercophora newfieldiana TaxID=92897 RepID=A0AA39YC19_9PEZI|nr:serine hydrolase-domain-containing protein [Cercophora newfieldiana]
MKFLCLPGAYGSAKNFAVQLGPLAEELSKRGVAEFTYSQGIHEVDPPTGWEDYFGARPLYRFLDTRRGDTFETLRRLRHVPHGMNPEDTMRMFQNGSEGEEWHQRAWRDALESVFQTIDEDPEIDAIIGYSEGAMVGASLVVEEGLREKRTGIPRRIKFAIFISGAPPLKMEGDKRITAQLADEITEPVIDIPTFHIFGCDDAFLSSAVALFNVCDQKSAMMYDHGLGHIVPRDNENVGILGNILGSIIPPVEEAARKQALAHASKNKMPKMPIRVGGEASGELQRHRRRTLETGFEMNKIEKMDFSTGESGLREETASSSSRF